MCELSGWGIALVICAGVAVQALGIALILYRRGRKRQKKEAARKEKAARFKTEEVRGEHALIQMATRSPAVYHWLRGDRRFAAIRDRHSREAVVLAHDLVMRFEKRHPECCRRAKDRKLEALLDCFRGFLDRESAKLIRDGKS